ncbi:MAG: type II CAAX prenyl endopeptidase Rce1 family protein [bacterium]
MPLFRDGKCPPLRRWSEPAQIAGFAACALFINLLAGFALAPLGFTNPIRAQQSAINLQSPVTSTLVEVVCDPAVETLYGQWLPLLAARFAKRSPIVQILWSAIWFTVLHIRYGPAYMIHTFLVGWILASGFLFCRQESWIKAYRATTLASVVHKAVMTALFFMFH